MFLYSVVGAVCYLEVCPIEDLGYEGGIFTDISESTPSVGRIL
jgi:hypothetical protein